MGLLTIVDIGIATHQEPTVYMRGDCEVCMAEGFSATTIGLEFQNRGLITTLNVVDDIVLEPGHIGLSKVALRRSRAQAGDLVKVVHAPPVKSLGSVRKKIFGPKLNTREIRDNQQVHPGDMLPETVHCYIALTDRLFLARPAGGPFHPLRQLRTAIAAGDLQLCRG